jgi:hypothetical protein
VIESDGDVAVTSMSGKQCTYRATAEELTRFRELRRQFEERRRGFQDDQEPGRRPFRRQRQRDGQQPGGTHPNQQPPNF